MTQEVHGFALSILKAQDLVGKMTSPQVINWEKTNKSYPGQNFVSKPARPKNLEFSSQQIKFPSRKAFVDPKQRARALHFFANHELLAIEMLANAIVAFPCMSDEDVKFKKTCIATLKDEQKHLSLYCNRMKELGIEFGDLPVNDFFWDKHLMTKSPEEFISLLSLTFESANLDFALYYEGLFEEVGDPRTAAIMREVYLDEISHVKTGVFWLNHWRQDEDLWSYYCRHLPDQITPARAKGIHFDRSSRFKANLEESFVNKLEEYRDDFQVTLRKQWKSTSIE